MPETITPFLWFDTEAEEAANFYISVFPNSRITQIVNRTKAVPVDAGEVLTVAFELDGRAYMALNGGPTYKFNEAVSLMVHCDSQAEIDRYWNALSDGGETRVCGWLKDRYGLSWQVVPKLLPELLRGSDPARTDRVLAAIMDMTKLDIAGLQAAYDG